MAMVTNAVPALTVNGVFVVIGISAKSSALPEAGITSVAWLRAVVCI
ncbi:MAG: hypothetical protein BWZ05_02339 [Bacteroidetes bacterium ADurb.BinA245]|nr:MAG: hypothetical protein BWZ05_02339 [Bacteroidetes bacterium ADurb.BinA245]